MPDDCPHCGTSLAPPPQEHPDWCLVWQLFGQLGQKDVEVERLRDGIRDYLNYEGGMDEARAALDRLAALLDE